MILQVGVGQQGSLGTIFSGIKRLFNPEGARREDLMAEIAANPGLGARLAQAGRNQLEVFSRNAGETDADSFFRPQTEQEERGRPEGQGGNPFAPILASIGLNPDDRNNIDFFSALVAAHPESFAQATDEQLVREPGAVGGAVEAVTTAAGASAAGSRAATAEAENLLRTSERSGEIEGPEQTAEIRLRNLQQATELNDLQIALTSIGVDDASEQLRIWEDYNAWLAANPEFRGLAGVASKNPRFLAHLEFVEQLSLQEQLALLKAQQQADVDRVKQLAGVLGITKSLQDIRMGTLRITEGTQRIAEGKASKEAKEAAAQLDRDTQALLEETGFSPSPFAPQIAEIEGRGDRLKPTVVSPPRAGPPGGGEPTSLAETRFFGAEQKFLDEGKAFLLDLAEKEGIDEVIGILQINPSPNIQRFVQALRDRGEFEQFLKDVRTISKDAREARLAAPSSRIGGLPLP